MPTAAMTAAIVPTMVTRKRQASRHTSSASLPRRSILPIGGTQRICDAAAESRRRRGQGCRPCSAAGAAPAGRRVPALQSAPVGSPAGAPAPILRVPIVSAQPNAVVALSPHPVDYHGVPRWLRWCRPMPSSARIWTSTAPPSARPWGELLPMDPLREMPAHVECKCSATHSAARAAACKVGLPAARIVPELVMLSGSPT